MRNRSGMGESLSQILHSQFVAYVAPLDKLATVVLSIRLGNRGDGYVVEDAMIEHHLFGRGFDHRLGRREMSGLDFVIDELLQVWFSEVDVHALILSQFKAQV